MCQYPLATGGSRACRTAIGAMLIFTGAANQSATVAPNNRRELTGYVMDNDSIKRAVGVWCNYPTNAQQMYGHISTWDTSGVTSMQCLFAAEWSWVCDDGPSTPDPDIQAFNDDITSWDTSNVGDMDWMFLGASSFNQPIGGWDVSKVGGFHCTFHKAFSFNQPLSEWKLNRAYDALGMFWRATSFDQDLGWCVDEDVRLDKAFLDSSCESTSCGVRHGNCPTPAPTHRPTFPPDDSSSSSDGGVDIGLVIGCLAGFFLLLGGCYFVRNRRTKGSEMEQKKEVERSPQLKKRSPSVEREPSRGVDFPPEPIGPLKARPEGEATVPNAEPPPPPAKGWWFSAAEPEGEPESAPFEAEAEAIVEAEHQPPGNWFSRAAPEPEPEFEPEPEC